MTAPGPRWLRWLLIASASLSAIALFLLATATSNTGLFAQGYDNLLILNGVLVTLLMLVVGWQLWQLRRNLKAGVTNVATIQLSNSSGNQLNFGAFVPGIPAAGTGYKSPFRNWHDLGHNPVMNGQNHKIIVDKWCMQKFADLIARMKGLQEPGGTMLDNTLIVWGNHMESGDNHFSQRIPWVFAGKGGAGSKVKVGTAASGASISNAMADICNIMGVTGAPHMTGTAGAV